MSALVHDRTSTLHPEAVEAPLLFPVPQEANTFLEKGLEREARPVTENVAAAIRQAPLLSTRCPLIHVGPRPSTCPDTILFSPF